MKNAAAQTEPITNPCTAFLEGAFVGEPQVPTTFERSAPAGSNSLAFPGSGAGLLGCGVPPGGASGKRIVNREE